MKIVYEDNHIIIVAKQSGEIVQGDKTGDTPLSDLVKQYIKEKYQKPGEVFLGVCHRLDRPVAGLVVFARTSKALARLNKMFAESEVHKTYWAIVPRTDEPQRSPSTPPASQLLTHWLVRNEKQNKSYAYDARCPAQRRRSCATTSSAGPTAICCWRWSCSPAATTKYAASWPRWGCPSRAT